MKTKLLNLLLLLSVVFVSCSHDDDNNRGKKREQSNNNYVNNWVYDQMNFWYYWNNKLPQIGSLNPEEDPYDFFDKLKYRPDEVGYDRFSWIMSNYTELLDMLNGVTPSDRGFEYAIFRKQDGKPEAIFIVTYVKAGTDAEKQGIKRGYIISKVDGVTITDKNYSSVMSSSKPHTVEGDNFVGKITFSPMLNYAEDPLFYSNIYEEKGRKIGYLVYNFFAADKGDGSHSYETILAKKFEEFYNANITDFVLDLRYNTGGLVQSSAYMASALIKSNGLKQTFARGEANANVEKKYGKDNFLFTDKIQLERGTANIPRLGDKIGELYILTGRNTASESELVINSLRPFRDVVLIGETTYGKNFGSVSVYEKNNKDNKWGIQPIVFKYSNKNGESDYAGGFSPNIARSEFALDENMKALGDRNELLLSTAINAITGMSETNRTKSFRQPEILGSSLSQKKSSYIMYTDMKDFEFHNMKE